MRLQDMLYCASHRKSGEYLSRRHNLRKIKFLSVFILIALVLSIVPGAALAQGPIQDKQQRLTPEEMANAVVVTSFDAPRSKGQGSVYRLANCDPAKSDPNVPCY